MTPSQLATEINRLIADRDNGNDAAQVEIDRLVVELEAHPEVIANTEKALREEAADTATTDLMMARFG